MLNRNELMKLLERYGIGSVNDYTMIDSSHGESDLRHNYIIDKKYVLRVNSAKVMGEKRIKELNRLIGRYNAFAYFIIKTNILYFMFHQATKIDTTKAPLPCILQVRKPTK